MWNSENKIRDGWTTMKTIFCNWNGYQSQNSDSNNNRFMPAKVCPATMTEKFHRTNGNIPPDMNSKCIKSCSFIKTQTGAFNLSLNSTKLQRRIGDTNWIEKQCTNALCRDKKNNFRLKEFYYLMRIDMLLPGKKPRKKRSKSFFRNFKLF